MNQREHWSAIVRAWLGSGASAHGKYPGDTLLHSPSGQGVPAFASLSLAPSESQANLGTLEANPVCKASQHSFSREELL